MVKPRSSVLLVFLVCFFASTVQADYDYVMEPRVRSAGDYESQSAEKATRGLTNVLMGWSEIVAAPTRWGQSHNHGVVSAVVVGVPYGIVRAIGRTLTGVYEIATFYAPQDPIFYPMEGGKF